MGVTGILCNLEKEAGFGYAYIPNGTTFGIEWKGRHEIFKMYTDFTVVKCLEQLHEKY